MKKHNIIFTPLLLTLTTMPFSVSALTVSGTVVDKTGEPLIGATIRDTNNKKNAVITDTDGKFTLNVEANHNLEVSYIGYKTQTIDNPTENIKITLIENSTNINEVKVVKKHQEGDTCGGQMLTDEHANKDAKGKYHKVGENWVCIPNECIQDYRVEGNVCVKYQCSTAEKESVLKSGAKGAKWDGTKCVPSKCDTDNGYTENENNECVLTNCTKAQLRELKKQQGVADGKLENGTCVPICKKNYHPNGSTCEANKCPTDEEDWDGTKCIKVRCTSDELKALNAKDGKWENGKCIPTKCLDEKNFKLENGTCGASECPTKELEKLRATAGYMQNNKCIPTACIDKYKLENNTCVNSDILAEKQKAYDEAKAKEQSFENRALTAATTAATGIGGMQLMQGLAEQSSDKDAAADMAAYIETMRCTYGDGKQVKAGPDEIELPGANDSELMKLRSEYLALAADLKERKEALGMKPGIESETILDRSATGLYDDENIAISGGNYGSLYRAQMLNSESDQAKIADEKSTSSNRVKGGAIAAGAGVVVGVAGNSLINGKLGEMLKSKKSKTEAEKLLEKEADALKDLQSCLKDAGVKDTDKLEFANFYPSVLTVKNMKCKNIKLKIKDVKASDIFADSTDEDEIFNSMNKYFDTETISKFVGFSKTEKEDNIKNEIKSAISEKQKEIAETKKKETEQKESKSKDSSSGIDIGNIFDNVDINDIKEKAGSLLG